ncbi:hypothetical protein [Actinomadura bangladeshensis]|uniref:Nucleoside 2-deoxyribosyltransferase n=1 Tax=Actinomadura bangladeshensis TaxID=453573 RepID=A0A4R4NNH4_9ACTN|nr:hypothetical protein [Actinomadura bangladeshensis]TDC09390.1 hypothetical protein E1284_29585 [Actinomadura bangladeshensis]
MKIYVAARFEERERVRNAYESLMGQGHVITEDWTVHDAAKPYRRNRELISKYAVRDVDAVRESDVFVFLTSPVVGGGSSTEFGVALSANLLFGRPLLYVVGEYTENNLCFFHPAVRRREDLDQVMRELAGAWYDPALRGLGGALGAMSQVSDHRGSRRDA